MEYEYVVTEDGDVLDCESCGSTAPIREFRAFPNGQKMLCEVCSTSTISRFTESNIQGEPVILMKIIAQVANLIIDKTTGRAPPTTDGDSHE